MANLSYGAGAPLDTVDALNILQDGWVLNSDGSAVVTVTPTGPADAVTFQNMSDQYVRATFAFTNTTATGNASVLVAPFGTFDEEFGGAVVQNVALQAVDLPPAGGTAVSVATLLNNNNPFTMMIKFAED